VSLERQGEADPIIDLMNEFALSSLLKQYTKTWQEGGQGGDYKSTINLILASENLTGSMVKYVVNRIEHGSNYHIIKTMFNILVLASNSGSDYYLRTHHERRLILEL
jgi:hypothetical protein